MQPRRAPTADEEWATQLEQIARDSFPTPRS